MKRTAGFTIIELMIVMAILGILLALAAPIIFGEEKLLGLKEEAKAAPGLVVSDCAR